VPTRVSGPATSTEIKDPELSVPSPMPTTPGNRSISPARRSMTAWIGSRVKLLPADRDSEATQDRFDGAGDSHRALPANSRPTALRALPSLEATTSDPESPPRLNAPDEPVMMISLTKHAVRPLP